MTTTKISNKNNRVIAEKLKIKRNFIKMRRDIYNIIFISFIQTNFLFIIYKIHNIGEKSLFL